MEAIELYIFANIHDAIGLRRACIDLIVELLNQEGQGKGINYRQADHIFENLPESSGLYRVTADNFVFNMDLATETAANEFIEWMPDAIIARRLQHCKPTEQHVYAVFRNLQPCDYHEHESDKEKMACAGYKKYPPHAQLDSRSPFPGSLRSDFHPQGLWSRHQRPD